MADIIGNFLKSFSHWVECRITESHCRTPQIADEVYWNVVMRAECLSPQCFQSWEGCLLHYRLLSTDYRACWRRLHACKLQCWLGESGRLQNDRLAGRSFLPTILYFLPLEHLSSAFRLPLRVTCPTLHCNCIIYYHNKKSSCALQGQVPILNISTVGLDNSTMRNCQHTEYGISLPKRLQP